MTLEHSHAMKSLVDFQQQNLSDTWFLSDEGLTGLLLILTLVFLPSGIVGGAQQLWHRLRARRDGHSTAVDEASAFEGNQPIVKSANTQVQGSSEERRGETKGG